MLLRKLCDNGSGLQCGLQAALLEGAILLQLLGLLPRLALASGREKRNAFPKHYCELKR